MDPRRSPAGVLNDHPEDQSLNLVRGPSPSDLSPDSGDQPPVHAEASPVPAGNGFGRDDEDARLLPSRPDPPSDYQEELIEGAEIRARMSTQSQIREKETLPSTKEADHHSETEPDEVKHGQDL
jgi:hypothetical protein